MFEIVCLVVGTILIVGLIIGVTHLENQVLHLEQTVNYYEERCTYYAKRAKEAEEEYDRIHFKGEERSEGSS